MISKNQLNNWIETIDKLRKDLHTGGGAVISANYSKENEELYNAATTCRNLLTIYFSYEGLSEEHLKRLNTVMEDMRQKAILYENAKEHDKTNPYTLHGDSRKGIIAATGDKYTRLKAASDLNIFALSAMKPVIDADMEDAKKEPRVISSEFKKIEEILGGSNLNASEIADNLNDFIKNASPKMEILNFHRKAVQFKKQYSKAVKNSFWGKNVTIKQIRDEFKEINNLHRLELLTYNNSEEFLNLYSNNRYKIRQVVDIYNWANKCKEGDEKHQRYYNQLRLSLGLTHEQFEKLGEKVSTLEMIGRHMDANISMYSNPEFTQMGYKTVKNISQMSKEELAVKLKEMKINLENPQLPQEYKPSENRFKYVKAAYALRSLEELGISKKTQGIGLYNRGEKSYINRTVGKNFKRGFKFLNVQGNIARPSLYNNDKVANLKLPVMTKAKLGKVSLKYSSENKKFSVGAHVGVFGGKVSGNVGFGFSLKNPLSSRIEANASAEVYGARGVAKAKFGSKDLGINGKVSGHIGHAKAQGGLNLGHIHETDDKGNTTTDGFGIDLKAKASAAVFNGKLTGGFSIFGVKISFETEGKAIAAGIEGQFKVIPNKGFKLGFGGALGLGGSVYLGVDWSGLAIKYKNWKKRKAISKETLKAKKAEEKLLKEEKKRKKLLEDKKGRMSVGNNDKNINSNNQIKRSNTLKEKKVRKL
ncbi:MAG TPA: hypothetical protein DEO83_03900 [Lachnospiraceae bacterium]|nr:hypothetical protein [Lachnospiraceae bacterium]